MKALVFAVCILATVTMGDAILVDVLKTLTSKVFDFAELLNFHRIYAQCALKLGLLNIAKPEISFCIAEKKNLIDKEGGIMWDESLIYIEKLVRDADKMDEIKALVKLCKEEADKIEGSKYEKSLKAMQCGLPMVRYIARQNFGLIKL